MPLIFARCDYLGQGGLRSCVLLLLFPTYRSPLVVYTQRNQLEVVKWIEALDPLQAGSILSRESMKQQSFSGGGAEFGRRRSGSVLF